MPQSDFYNENTGRSYPFVTLDEQRAAAVQNTADVFVDDRMTVDFGCVFGIGAAYDPTVHSVWLESVSLSSGFVTFAFRTDVPGCTELSLEFSHPVDAVYAQSFEEAELAVGSTGQPDEDGCVHTPLWEGYLVTGHLQDVQDDGGLPQTLSQGQAKIEPALIQGLDKRFVRTVNLANASRLITKPLGECSEQSSFFLPSDDIIVNATCLTGPLVLREGFNCTIRQETTSNSLLLSVDKGGGLGEPCEEVKLYNAEPIQPNSNLLSGGPECRETLQSINGVAGPFVTFRGDSGVNVAADSENPHKLLVTIDFRDLLFCPADFSSETTEEYD